MAKGWTVVRMIMVFLFYVLSPPLKGKRLTTFCALLALPHPLLSLTHWIFRSLMLPYKSSSLVQNVFAVHRFARGGRRLAVRTAMEHPTGALPRTPFPASRDFAPGGKHVTGFSGRFALLQIQFLCHLKGKRENRWHWILCHI